MRLLNVCRSCSPLLCFHLLAEDSASSCRTSTGFNGDANGDGKRHSYQDEFVELFNPSR